MKITKKQLELLILEEIRNSIQEQTDFGSSPLFARWSEWFSSPIRTFANNFRQGAQSAGSGTGFGGSSYGSYGSYDYTGEPSSEISGSGAPTSTAGASIGAPILDTLRITPQRRENVVAMSTTLNLNEQVVANNTAEQLETQFRNSVNNFRSSALTNVRTLRQRRFSTLLFNALNTIIQNRRGTVPNDLQTQAQTIATNESNITNLSIRPQYNNERKITNVIVELSLRGSEFAAPILQAAQQVGFTVNQNESRVEIRNAILRLAQAANQIYQNSTLGREST